MPEVSDQPGATEEPRLGRAGQEGEEQRVGAGLVMEGAGARQGWPWQSCCHHSSWYL